MPRTILAAALVSAIAVPAAAQDAKTADRALLQSATQQDHKTMMERLKIESLRPGAKMMLLEGDPTKEGPFVVRFLFPDGYHVAPHTHPKTERVTVISGVLHLATGEALDRNSAKGLPAGSFGFWPAGMKHTAWSEGETIIQLHGVGPWQINYVNPADDPRNAKK